MQNTRPFVLTIGGFDPCGGAGILADNKTLTQLKVMNLSVLTCNTLQTENHFFANQWVDISFIKNSIFTIMNHYPVAFAKIGVVQNATMIIQIVETILSVNPQCKIIWDTVLVSSSGFEFFDKKQLMLLKNILPKIYLITPNFIEYQILKEANLFDSKNPLFSILKKGGHNTEQLGIDILHYQGQQIKISTENQVFYPKHGSGCVLASAITAYLSLGNNLITSCKLAKKYIHHFLKSNDTLLGLHNV